VLKSSTPRLQLLLMLSTILPSTLLQPKTSIFSDNSSAISTLAQANSGLILRHRKLLQPSIDFLRNQNRQIILNWVPSHCNIPGNERADSLAKSAASTPDSPQHPMTPSYLKRILEQTRHKLWQKAFENRTSGAVYDGNPSLKSAPTYHWNRHTSRALLHFRTGHGFFASTRHTTAELSNQLCSCKSKETRDHILLHCPRYHRTRIKFFQALQLSPDDVTLPPAATITRTLLYPKPPKKSLYNRWDTRIKMLNTDKDGKDTNLKALKLVRRFIKDWIS
jgi:hypothetical protein